MEQNLLSVTVDVHPPACHCALLGKMDVGQSTRVHVITPPLAKGGAGL